MAIPWKQFGADPGLFCEAESLPDDVDWTDPSHVGKPATIRALQFWKERQTTTGQGLVFKAWYHKKEMHERPPAPKTMPDDSKGKRKVKPLPKRKVQEEETVVAESTSVPAAKSTRKRGLNAKETPSPTQEPDHGVEEPNFPSSPPASSSPGPYSEVESVADDTDLQDDHALSPSPEDSPATTRPQSPENGEDTEDGDDLLADLAKLRLTRSVSGPTPASALPQDTVPDSNWSYLESLTTDPAYLDMVATWRDAMKEKVSPGPLRLDSKCSIPTRILTASLYPLISFSDGPGIAHQRRPLHRQRFTGIPRHSCSG